MPSAARYITKDSHPAIRAVADAKAMNVRGRRYSAYHAAQPGGIRAKDLVLGMQLACLAITDDTPGTLKNVGKANPWQVQAMTMITGSKQNAHEPLSAILRDHFQLQTDHILNISGLSAACHALDTQGYIAHNDKIIVLSYRCTTSASDWLTNLTTTTSAWDIDHDVAQGHSGYLSSCLDYACCSDGPEQTKPRVHTGFYNNFLVTVPAIRQYIDPLLAADQPERTLYVVGHSLGAGIAVMAACHFLTEPAYDWRTLPHKLRVVTAGGPRACCQSMQERVDGVLRKLRYTDKVVLARLVRDKDVVPTMPPELFGFRHLTEKLVYLTKEDDDGVGSVLVNPDLRLVVPINTLKALLKQDPSILSAECDPRTERPVASESSDEADEENAPTSVAEAGPDVDGDDDDDNDDDNDDRGDGNFDEKEAARRAKYEERVKLVPRAFRDHMPDFYLRPLLHLHKQELAEKNLTDWDTDDESCSSSGQGYQPLNSEGSSASSVESSTNKKPSIRKGMGRLFRFRKARNQLTN